MFAVAYMGRKRILRMLSLPVQRFLTLDAVFLPRSKSIGRATRHLCSNLREANELSINRYMLSRAVNQLPYPRKVMIIMFRDEIQMVHQPHGSF